MAEMTRDHEACAKSLRWTANMMGGVDQPAGFFRTASYYCERAAKLLEDSQKYIEELEAKRDEQDALIKRMERALDELEVNWKTRRIK